MFKNFAVQTKVVKTNKKNDPTKPVADQIGEASAKLVTELAKDVLKRAAITIGAVVVTVKVIDILGEIAVKKTKSADNK